MTYFIFVVSGDGSCHRLESRSASMGERRCDMSLGSWLKILHLATKTATSFLQIRNHNGSYIVSMGFGGRSEVWRAPYLAIPGAPPLAVPVIESTFLLLYVWALLHSGNALAMPWWRAECLCLYFGMVSSLLTRALTGQNIV